MSELILPEDAEWGDVGDVGDVGDLAAAGALPRFVARSYQLPFRASFQALEYKHYFLDWPRQTGKDTTIIDALTDHALERPANYYHCLPKYEQCRKSIWENIDAETGFRLMDLMSPYAQLKDSDMTAHFPNGAIYRLIGSDNYNTILGAGPFIIVYSEWARCDPEARGYFLPMLMRNGGVEVFVTTMRPNHAADLAAVAEARHGQDWFYSKYNVEQCFRDAPGEDGTRVVAAETIESQRAEFKLSLGRTGMSDELIQQEYYNSRLGVMEGSILGKQMEDARKAGRICDLPILSGVPVDTYWDLGRRDSTAIWFVQQDGPWFNVIDYLEAFGAGIEWYAEALQAKKYVYRPEVWPHDGKHQVFGLNESRRDGWERLTGRAPEILKVGSIADGINAMRTVISRCRFDITRCARGIECLRMYRYEFDEKRKVFGVEPAHDQYSHGADAFRTFATRMRGPETVDSGRGMPPRPVARGPRGWMAR